MWFGLTKHEGELSSVGLLFQLGILILVIGCFGGMPPLGNRGEPAEIDVSITQLWSDELHPEWRSRVAISGDNRLAAVFDFEESQICVVSLETGEERWTHQFAVRPVHETDLVFSPDSRRLLFFDPDGSRLFLFGAETGDLQKTIEYQTGLYSPTFQIAEVTDEDEIVRNSHVVYCFAGEKTFEVVEVDLSENTVEPYFDFLEYSSQTGCHEPYGGVFYRRRDFEVYPDRLVIGLDGFAMSFDTIEAQLQWRTRLSGADPIWLHPTSETKFLAVAATDPRINELQIDTGEVFRSLTEAGDFQGFFGKYVMTESSGVINFPENLRLLDWEGRLLFEHELSSTHLIQSVYSSDGQFVLTIDALGVVRCIKLELVDQEDEESDEPAQDARD